MIIAFCVISNRLDKLERMISTFNNATSSYQTLLAISYQDPISKNNINRHSFIIAKKRPMPAGMLNFCEAREHSFKLAKGADYLVMIDDDFRFKEGAGARYVEAAEYLESNPGCGMVILKGYLG